MPRALPLRLAPEWGPDFTVGVGVSALLHLAVGLLLAFLATLAPPPPPPLSSYTVELTDPSALGGRLAFGPLDRPLGRPRRISEATGGASAGPPTPGEPAAAPTAPPPKTVETPKPVEPPAAVETAKLPEPPTPPLAAKPADVPPAAESPTSGEPAKPIEQPKAAEAPRPVVPEKPAETPKAPELPKPGEPRTPAVRLADKSKPPERPKAPEPKPEAKPEPRPEPPRAEPRRVQRPPAAPGTVEARKPVAAPVQRTDVAKVPSGSTAGSPAVAAKARPARPADTTPTAGVGEATKPQTAAPATGVGGAGSGGSPETPVNDEYEAAAERWRSRMAGGGGGMAGLQGGRGPIGDGTTEAGGGGTVVGFEFLAYRQRIVDIIKRNWSNVVRRTGLIAWVRFEVGPEGEVANVRLERSSGDQAYDQSVLRAVQRSSPLPPPPERHRDDFREWVIDFHSDEAGRGTG